MPLAIDGVLCGQAIDVQVGSLDPFALAFPFGGAPNRVQQQTDSTSTTIVNKGDQTMSTDRWLAALACSLLMASTASAQVQSGVMTVTGAEMH